MDNRGDFNDIKNQEEKKGGRARRVFKGREGMQN